MIWLLDLVTRPSYLTWHTILAEKAQLKFTKSKHQLNAKPPSLSYLRPTSEIVLLFLTPIVNITTLLKSYVLY